LQSPARAQKERAARMVSAIAANCKLPTLKEQMN